MHWPIAWEIRVVMSKTVLINQMTLHDNFINIGFIIDIIPHGISMGFIDCNLWCGSMYMYYIAYYFQLARQHTQGER